MNIMKIRHELKWLIQRVKNIWHFFRSFFWVVYYGYPARNLRVIGITGTDGKTTTTTLIYEILKDAGFKAGLISTVGARYLGAEKGEVNIETGLHATNPEARELQYIIKRMVEAGVSHLVLEVTAHGLDQYRVFGTNINIGVVTNLSHEHLDDFVTMERYAMAKAKLIFKSKYIVLNQDDEWYEFFKSQIKNHKLQKIISYSKTNMPNVEIPNSLKGDYNKYNLAAAEAVAKTLEIPEEIILKAVRDFKGVAGRREEVENNRGLKVFVDFAHTPNALKNVLSELRHETKGKLIAVFGCTGERDRTKRPMMGKIASDIADAVIITSDDTREENQDDISREIISGIDDYEDKLKSGALMVENDRRKAIRIAFSIAKPGDTVLLAGKGHEKSINLGGVEHLWSDVNVAQDELASF